MDDLPDGLIDHPVARSSAVIRSALESVRPEQIAVHHLGTEEVLTQAGSLDNRLFVVLEGRLAVLAPSGVAVGTSFGPGAVCGEIGYLTGMARSASIVATEPSVVAAIDGGADTADIPQLRDEAVRRLRAAMLVDVLTETYGLSNEAALSAFTEVATIEDVPAGSSLFTSEQAGVALVLLGSFRVGTDEGLIARAGRSEILGEMSWLNGNPRSADVVAAKDSIVARFDAANFERLTLDHPETLLTISRILAGRLSRDPIFRMSKPPRPLSVAIISGHASVDVETMATVLAEHLDNSAFVTPERIERALAQPGSTESLPGTPQSLAVDTWLDLEEPRHEITFLVGDDSRLEWNRRIIRQADRVILALDTAAGPELTPVEQALQPELDQADLELVLVHRPSTEQPTDTRDWLERRTAARHHHIRQGHRRDIARTARQMAGVARGLVLGGGGARGYASIGVGLALEEAGYDVDVVGGTSMGALVGAGLALHGAEFMVGMARRHGSRRKLHDPTLPLTSVFASRLVTSMLRTEYGDTLIEDMWVPFFAVATNLSTAEEVVIDRGPLWEAVRASIAIPGVFSPISRQGDLLVDGGIMNNLPIDVMRTYCEQGPVIAVNVSPRESSHRWNIAPQQSGWSILANRLNPFRPTQRAPSIAGTVLRSLDTNSVSRVRQYLDVADLVIQPDVKAYSVLEWDSHDAVIEAGRLAAAEALEGWVT